MVSACHPAYSSPLPGRKALSVSCADQAEPSGPAQVSRGLSESQAQVRGHRFQVTSGQLSQHIHSLTSMCICAWRCEPRHICVYTSDGPKRAEATQLGLRWSIQTPGASPWLLTPWKRRSPTRCSSKSFIDRSLCPHHVN